MSDRDIAYEEAAAEQEAQEVAREEAEELEPASALAAIDVTPVDHPMSPAEEFALKLLTESWIDETGQHDRMVMARLIQEAELAIREQERAGYERRVAELTERTREAEERVGYLEQEAADIAQAPSPEVPNIVGSILHHARRIGWALRGIK